MAVSNGFFSPYLSDPLFTDAAGRMHLAACVAGPHDGFYTYSTNGGVTWSSPVNITREGTASKGGTVYINNTTGTGLYMGFFNVSGYNLNYSSDGGLTWTTGAYRFIPGATSGLTGYIYPLGSAYDGLSTVYAATWGSKYHWGNGKIGLSKSTDLGRTWTSMAGVSGTNTMLLEAADSYAVDSIDLLVDADGVLYVFYLAYGTDGKWKLKAYNTLTGMREVVCDDLGYARFACTALAAWLGDDGKTVNVGYARETGPNELSTMYHAVRSPAGVWSPPAAIGSDGFSRRPYQASAAIDSDGNACILWATWDGTKYRIMSSVLPGGAADWEPLTEIITTAPGVSASSPIVRPLDHPGEFELVWSQHAPSRSTQYGRLRVVGGQPVDTTPPAITPEVSGALGDNGWYTSDVTVSWSVTDPESAIRSVVGGDTVVIDYDTPGTTLVCEATSDGGSAAASVTIKRDATPPVIHVVSPVNGAGYLLGEPVAVEWSATDALSGLDAATGSQPSGAMLDTASVGERTLTVTARDSAGNVAERQVICHVRYTFSGILPPIDPGGSSLFKLGSTVPVKFALTDASGRPVANAVAKLYLAPVVGGQAGTERPARPSGRSSDGNLFRYDREDAQYVYNLATKELAAGLWQLRIELDDGSSHHVCLTLR
jgi:hypothetical protein